MLDRDSDCPGPRILPVPLETPARVHSSDAHIVGAKRFAGLFDEVDPALGRFDPLLARDFRQGAIDNFLSKRSRSRHFGQLGVAPVKPVLRRPVRNGARLVPINLTGLSPRGFAQAIDRVA